MHRQNLCKERSVKCPFSKYGHRCASLKAKDLPKHIEENKYKHLELKSEYLEKKVEKMEEKMNILQRRVRSFFHRFFLLYDLFQNKTGEYREL